MRVRDYAGPLGVLAAGAIGVSLLCSVSALAIGDLNSQSLRTLEPLNIVELAVDNLSTVAALTQQAVMAFVPTPTLGPTRTAFRTPTAVPSDTATVRPTFTPRQPTPTRRPRLGSLDVPPVVPPTRTRTPLPPPTQPPTQTKTALPTASNTALPPTATNTPLPPPTDPPPPTSPATNTSVPPPTATEILPTNTPLPPTSTEPGSTETPVQILDSTPTLSP